MRRFLIKIGVAGLIIIALHVITLLLFSNGRFDDYYLNFTTPRQNSLIMGNSRSAQGIVPAILDSLAGYDSPIYNYSFSVSRTLYGPYYNEAVYKKLNTESSGGYFIVSVDPISLSVFKTNLSDDTTKYIERNAIPYIIKYPTLPVNIEYILKAYYKGWGHMIIDSYRSSNPKLLHNDGWLEVTIDFSEKQFETQIPEKIQLFATEYFGMRKPSHKRIGYLKELLNNLKAYGDVYAVRIPVHSKMREVEDRFDPQFDNKMKTLCEPLAIPYFTFSPDDERYKFTDGNHLRKEWSFKFSRILSDSIRSYRN